MLRLRRFTILWLLPFVLVPLGAMLVLQYRSLRSLEATTASAERNALRSSLEDVTCEIESSYRAAAARALDVDHATLDSDDAVAAHFRGSRIGGAKTFFAVRFEGDSRELAYFDAAGREKEVGPAEDQAVRVATVSWHALHKLKQVITSRALLVDDRQPQLRMIMMPITDEALHVVGVTGVVLDEALAKQSIIAIGSRIVRSTYGHDDVAIRIGDAHLFAAGRAPGDHEYITQALGFVFSGWRIGLRDACASPEDIAACNFRINMAWTGVVALLLLGAIGIALRATARELRVSRMKSDFVSNVSHELRTPLSSIRVFGEYMRLGRVEKPEKIREYGEYIETESRRLTQLINNILDFSKIESAEKTYRFAPTDLGDFVAQTVAAFELPLRENGVTVRVHALSLPLPNVLVDRDALAQVLVNLLDNAVKYSAGRKEIDVRVSAGHGDVRVAIEDHGIGIAPREQRKIFDKFYRVGSTLVHDVKGSGLGLAIVMHVVKAHGGRIEVVSAPGAGSVFTIILPALPDASTVAVGQPELA